MTKWPLTSVTGVIVAAVLGTACGSGSRPSTPTAATPLATVDPSSDPTAGGSTPPGSNPTSPEIPIGTGTAVVAAVADVGWCGSPGVALTSRLLQSIAGQVILAGDLAYMNGRLEQFRSCFDPDYGRFRSRWRPAPGNHEYEDAGNGYFAYFGDAAGPARRGYYSFQAAAWQVLMLNSSVPASTNSPQYLWVRDELRDHPSRCTLAVWHHPYVSSGPNGPNIFMRDMWTLLHEYGADVVVSGHDHLYERFAPQNPAYQSDPQRGIRQFTVGTGGAPLYRPVARFPNSEIVVESWGALKLTLHPMTYEWEFTNASTNLIVDRGTSNCH